MKQLYFLCVCTLCIWGASATTANAQLQSRLHYKIKNGYRAINGDAPDIYYGKVIKDDSTQPKPEQRMLDTDVLRANVKQKGDTLLLDFWNFAANPSAPTSPRYKYVSPKDSIGKHGKVTYLYFMQIPQRDIIGEPVTYISLPYATTEVGVATVPFKFRRGNTSKIVSNQLLSDISLGPYIGRKWGRTRFYNDKERNHNSVALTIAFMASPTIISIDSTNTKGEVKTKSDEMGITTAIAAMYAYRDINIGLYLGTDNPVTGRSGKWAYASKPWIGFGIGYKINLLGAKE
jgi:hypothetical protein